MDRKYRLVVKVTGLERVGPIGNKRENPTVVFDVSSNVPTFRKSNHTKVKKCADEFRQLFKYLNGALQESFIPALPPTFTNFGINSNDDYAKTVANFQQWFDRVCENPLVVRNEEMAFFIESDFNTYSPTNSFKLPASGLKRKTLKQLSPPYDEVVELAEFRPQVKALHWGSQEVQSKLIKVCRARKILAQEQNTFGQRFATLNDTQVLYKKFGKILTATGDINSVMVTLDYATLYDGLEWIVKDTYVVKEALTNRHLVMRELVQAQQLSKTRQENARKLRAKRDISPLKVDEALRQLKVATQDENELTDKLQRITKNMTHEREHWLQWYENILSSTIKEYTMRKIEYERKKLTLLERVRTDVRRADSNGGLSRLGRKSTNPSTNTSQSTEGDTWTGEHRQRTQVQVDKVAHTEFDKTLGTTETLKNDTTSLDARHAARMLGLPTF